MNAKKAVKEAEKQLRKDPDNLVLRLKLAAAYREAARTRDAVELYRSVAVAYHGQGRLAQAVAVCRSVLEIQPEQAETLALLGELESMRAQQADAAGPEARSPLAGARPGYFDPAADPLAAAAGPGVRSRELGSIPGLPRKRRSSADFAGASGLTPHGRERPLEPGARSGLTPHPREPSREFGPRTGFTPHGREPSSDFGARSGMTPHSEPELPPLREASTPRRLAEAAGLRDQVRKRTTERMAAPPERYSVPLLTPTPLPDPLALHDLDDSQPDLARAGGYRGAVPPQHDDDAPTRIADDVAGEDAMTTIAPEIIEELDEAEALIDPAYAGDHGDYDPAAPESFDAQHDDDAKTTIAGDGGWPGQRRSPPRSSYFDQDTRRIDAPARLIANSRPTAPLPGPTRPPAREPSIPPELAPYQRGNLLDVESTFGEEPTDPREHEHTRPGERLRVPPPAPSRLDSASDAAVPTAPFARVPAPEPERAYAATVRALGPDGSAIESPLDIFAGMPDDALAELSRRMHLRHFRAGEIVLREGDPGDACYIIATGTVRILKRAPDRAEGEPVEVTRLGDGALFGEFALLADRRRHATVQAVSPCDIYEIPRKLLRELAATFTGVGALLERFYRERLLATLLATAPFFHPMAVERRSELLGRFRPIRSESGERIVSEGEGAGGLYLVVLGSVEITKRVGDARSVLLATLGEGSYFGEMSLLSGGVASASVTAVGPTELAVLPPKDFYDVVSRNPALWAEVKREAHRRELMNNQIVAGDTSIV